MKIVLFTHPEFLQSNSMPRFANMIIKYLEALSIPYEIWMPKPLFYRSLRNNNISKWLGYVDQYIIFPLQVFSKLKSQPKNTLYVFCDQALGPWVPLVAKYPHVIHCHDFMALKSALGLHPENITSFTGRLYQRFIRHGFEYGKNFISISNKTRDDLHKFSKIEPNISEVVYNGLNFPYSIIEKKVALQKVISAGILTEDSGCILHVGAGQWYKNTIGIIKIYAEYCNKVDTPKPLILVSPNPKGKLLDAVNTVPANGNVKFIQGIDVRVLEALYSYADIFLFPSLAEGFGWPIIEAQACGCPVITTNVAPMNEIGGPVANYLEVFVEHEENQWVAQGVSCVIQLLSLSVAERKALSVQAINWSTRFNTEETLNSYLNIYKSVVAESELALNLDKPLNK